MKVTQIKKQEEVKIEKERNGGNKNNRERTEGK